MCTCTIPPESRTDPIHRRSLHEDCIVEADRHKWIMSEKAGRDLGEEAIRAWVRKHWWGFLRDRWLEHLEGRNYWIELDHKDFGLLQREFQDSPYLPEIVRQLKARGENLSIILWVIAENLPMDEIRPILQTLDINSWRIECQLEAHLSSLAG